MTALIAAITTLLSACSSAAEPHANELPRLQAPRTVDGLPLYNAPLQSYLPAQSTVQQLVQAEHAAMEHCLRASFAASSPKQVQQFVAAEIAFERSGTKLWGAVPGRLVRDVPGLNGQRLPQSVTTAAYSRCQTSTSLSFDGRGLPAVFAGSFEFLPGGGPTLALGDPRAARVLATWASCVEPSIGRPLSATEALTLFTDRQQPDTLAPNCKMTTHALDELASLQDAYARSYLEREKPALIHQRAAILQFIGRWSNRSL